MQASKGRAGGVRAVGGGTVIGKLRPNYGEDWIEELRRRLLEPSVPVAAELQAEADSLLIYEDGHSSNLRMKQSAAAAKEGVVTNSFATRR